MTKPKSPQEKKELSYIRDRRNDYGENAKASRKNIPRAKTNAKRAERHEQNQAVRSAIGAESEEQLIRAEITATTPKDRWWKKLADTPLGEYLTSKRSRRG
jgi:O6-methylguanine-DNA--protein-cysteine methyltransferase